MRPMLYFNVNFNLIVLHNMICNSDFIFYITTLHEIKVPNILHHTFDIYSSLTLIITLFIILNNSVNNDALQVVSFGGKSISQKWKSLLRWITKTSMTVLSKFPYWKYYRCTFSTVFDLFQFRG